MYDLKKGNLGINAVCIGCDKRYNEGTQDYIAISMCQPCIDNYKSRHKTRDYSGFEEAIELVYSKLKYKAAPKRVKTLQDYLR